MLGCWAHKSHCRVFNFLSPRASWAPMSRVYSASFIFIDSTIETQRVELGLSIFPVLCQKGEKNRSSHRFQGALVPYRRHNLKWVLFVLCCILYWYWVLLGKVTLSHNVTPGAFKPSFGWNSDKYFLSNKDQLSLQPSGMALEILFLFFFLPVKDSIQDHQPQPCWFHAPHP